MNPKIAIVCDWLIGGGAERVVAELHKLYPDAPIYTSYATKRWQEELDGKVITGYLQKWPFSKLRKFIPPLRALWFSRLDLSEYDVVISASGAEAKFVCTTKKERLWKRYMHLFAEQGAGENRKGIAQKSTVHISYIHAPTHYYWSRYNDYMKNPGFGWLNWLARIGLFILVSPMRRLDYRAAQRPDVLIANSSHIKNEIEKYYARQAKVIFPPVNIARFNAVKKSEVPHHFVCIGRLAPYKRIDLAVKACTKLNLPLMVLGGGPELFRLQQMAGPSVSFMPSPTDDQINNALGSAKAFIFPGLDDFGIAPVEALASGTPVIAYQAGGALDYVKDGQNGIFFDKPTVASLSRAIKKLNSTIYAPNDIKASARRFSEDHFAKSITNAVENVIK